MNLEQVATYIREPYTLGLNQADDLKRLCEDFPYTAIYPLLYLTALSNAKSPALESALEQYAYRLSDRSRLFDLVSQVAATPEVKAADPEPEEILPEEPVTSTAHTPETGQPEKVTEEQPEQVTAEIVQLPEDPAHEHSAPDIDAKETGGESFDYFTTASSVGQDYFSLEDEEDVESPVSEAEVETEAPEAEVPETVVHSEPAPEIATGPRSFTDWLKSNGPKTAGEEKTASDPALSKDQLIDRFIETQPTITRQKAEFFSPPKKAKESLNEDAMPVSETLARIFTMQGNYPKAIHVYHQLMLANPEKKTFFAVQIEELKKKLTL